MLLSNEEIETKGTYIQLMLPSKRKNETKGTYLKVVGESIPIRWGLKIIHTVDLKSCM